LIALPGLPLVSPGDDLVRLVLDALGAADVKLQDGDVLVIAQKIVSKAEDRYCTLADIEPSDRAIQLAREVDKDPRLVEIILSESAEVVAHRTGVLVVEHRLGFVLANAGVDASNISQSGGPDVEDQVLLLPLDPDSTCRQLRAEFEAQVGVDIAVVINDSVGRAWRQGTIGMALGAAGLPSLNDLRGDEDLFGRTLRVSEVALADEIAAAASLLQGQGAEGLPVVLVRGVDISGPELAAQALVRPKEEDMFR